ncbi:Clp protease N-terminal domain-containing protein [Catenuloplanes atrovinosus]|uniref:Clp R domain-containing protein n=1 Tax=Catenuloplanes atrovinosus TaxID=137266 RepID=A0AAE3YQJ9_9ACTN|nr:Clp protease N-terminal domain-containing protein [Catenuloplanes atrovinosus]MDR7277432.1 hypothetical protein [Catenuloplanes atrovinosus]
MENILLEDSDVLPVFGFAVLRADTDEPISTDNLLVGLASAAGTREILHAADVTRTVADSVYRRRRAGWHSDDRGGPVAIVVAEGGTPADFTAAAADALRRAGRAATAHGRDVCDSRDLLLALLDDDGNRASELLAACAVPVAALRESLEHDRPLRRADRVPRELHRIRDMLIGLTRYPRVPLWRNPLLAIVAPARPNLAPQPFVWLMLESREQAREHGRRRPGTDDALLALMAMHELSRYYPHLYEQPYDGAAALASAGVTYAALRHVSATADLGTDPRPLRRAVPRLPADTVELVRLLLADRHNRANRLLAAAGFGGVTV